MDRYLDEQMFRFNNRLGMIDGVRPLPSRRQTAHMGGTDRGEGGLNSLTAARFGDVGVSLMRGRLLVLDLSEPTLDFRSRDGEDGRQRFCKLLMLR
jgi:hypothetical protein